MSVPAAGNSHTIEKPNQYLSREQWFALPLALRQRWWRETEFDRKPPSKELLQDAMSAITEIGKREREGVN